MVHHGPLCGFCDELHPLDECCECAAPADGSGRFGHLCASHANEAYKEWAAEAAIDRMEE